MTKKMKVSIILMVFAFFLLANCSEDELLDDVGKLVKTWNKRHSNRNDVVILTIGKSNIANGLAKRISGDNAIVFPQPKSKLKTGKPSFVIIISDVFDPVSEVNVKSILSQEKSHL